MNIIIIVFTHVQNKYGVNPKLKQLIQEKLGISLSKHTVFTLNNPFSLWENWNNEKDKSYIPEMTKEFKKLFSEDLVRFCAIVRSLGKINSESIIAFHDLKDEIDLKIAEVCESKARKSKLQNGSVLVVQDDLNYDRGSKVPSRNHNTICMAGQCFSNCHTPCSYSGHWLNSTKYCKVFTNDVKCSECGHHYSLHRRSKVRYITEKIVSSTKPRNDLSIPVDTFLQEIGDKIQRLQIQLLFLLAEYHRKSNRSYQQLVQDEIELHQLTSSSSPTERIVMLKNISKEASIIDRLPCYAKLSFEDKIKWALTFLGLESVKSPKEIDVHIKKILPDCCNSRNDSCSELFQRAKSILTDEFHRSNKCNI